MTLASSSIALEAFFKTRSRLVLGSRGSPLALCQADMVRAALLAQHPALDPNRLDIKVIQTSGDRIQDKPLTDLGGKGLFTKELEEALLTGVIDAAVHSMKDMATQLPDGLAIGAVLPRADVRDMLLPAPRLGNIGGIEDIPQGACLGSSSIRRRAQMLRMRLDLRVADFRGNVETRLRKLEEGQADITLLAAAGLARLGLSPPGAVTLDPAVILPAPAQGAIGVELRAGDEAAQMLFAALEDLATRHALNAERAFLAALDGSCRTPLAALARLDDRGRIHLIGEIIKPDGSVSHRTERHGDAADAARLGRDAGEELKRHGGSSFFI